MVAEFLRFFTKQGAAVLDPFLGSGATLVACAENERVGVGVELNERYAHTAAQRTDDLPGPQTVVTGDACKIGRPEFWRAERDGLEEAGIAFARGLPQFDFAITSPPYWRMLRTSRGGVVSKHKQRAGKGLDTVYSDDPSDLGNIADYQKFISALGRVFDRVRRCVKDGKYLVVVAQSLRDPDGDVKPLAWDLARRIEKPARSGVRWRFQGERIWCQNTKPLGIWGYPKIFVPNYHHHYCLIFQKTRSA
jgi:DNA modification methylase